MAKRLIGMLHLPALPGSPLNEAPTGSIEEGVVEEARLLRDAGFDAAFVENFGDVPFYKDEVPAITVAAMTRIVARVRRDVPELEVGVNVLRNDARAAVAIASATESHFVRVNVHVGATATDQGVIEARAAETLRLRASLGANVAIWADVHVKHGRSIAHASIADEAEDAVGRGLADALIVSGQGTGKAASLDDVRAVKELGLGVPVYLGSGVTEDNVREFLGASDGVIVGTSLKRDGRTMNPIDPERARRFVARARKS